ncbi:hypothetical protein [Hymenobacter properus]|uniref:DUF4034 domain-containing protein n=1 Tax=Hymenobacter properus TaxID=2791026 RepID=A0A931BKT8_9BACT|nr:hypothetical protein [Hymenobacter properus]MBF9141310.1 hypothetical protein [Hymenobacter properus]MBR7720120.1 hypothetical protein [Microvirga sp. SRT04]
MLQFFRSLFAKASPAATDLSYGLLTQLEIEPLLTGNQWEKLEATATALATDDLSRLLDGWCLSHRYAPAIQRYLAAGSSELRQLVAGVHATFLAWEARGGLIATETTQGQADGFFHYLNQAYDHLNQPFENPAFQAEAAARLVRVGMGLGERELATDAFAVCAELAPTHLTGHYNYMRLVSPWWHEGLEDLTSYVDSIADPALRRLFQLLALHEIHSFLGHEHNSVATATKLLKQDYRARIDQVLAGPGRAEGNSLAAIYYNNYLAGLHHILGNTAARNQLIQTLGAHFTPYPWQYFGLNNAAAVQSLLKS